MEHIEAVKTTRRRKRVTKGGRPHWAITIIFAIITGILLFEAYSVISNILIAR